MLLKTLGEAVSDVGDGVAEVDDAIAPHFVRADREANMVGKPIGTGLEQGPTATAPADRREEKQAYLVDEPRLEKRPIGVAAAFQEQAPDPEAIGEDIEDRGKVDRLVFGDDVGDAVGGELRQMRVRYIAAENHDDRRAVRLRPRPVELAILIDQDGVIIGTGTADVDRPCDLAMIARWMGLAIRELFTDRAPGDPGITFELVVHPVIFGNQIVRRAARRRAPLIDDELTVERAHHVADDVRLHVSSPEKGQHRASAAPRLS